MALIQFVQNYQDLSTDRGFQFKFHCDKCGNGYMTRFQTSTFGVAASRAQPSARPPRPAGAVCPLRPA